MQDLLKSPLIKVVQTIPKDNHELATAIWRNNKLSAKGHHYQDYYPVIVETTPRQLITANDICLICETHLLALLSELIDSITNINLINAFINANKLGIKNHKIIISSPLYTLRALINVAYNNDSDPNLVQKNFKIKKQQIQSHIDNLEMRPLTYRKYLIIFDLYHEDNNYHKLKDLDDNLNHYCIASIANILEKLIHYLASDLIDNDFTYQLNQNANLSEYEKWLTTRKLDSIN